jgi:hypothetical protein
LGVFSRNGGLPARGAVGNSSALRNTLRGVSILFGRA